MVFGTVVGTGRVAARDFAGESTRARWIAHRFTRFEIPVDGSADNFRDRYAVGDGNGADSPNLIFGKLNL
jgi:hypothetical protein